MVNDEMVWSFALRLWRVALAGALHWVRQLILRYFCTAAVAGDSALAGMMRGDAGSWLKSVGGADD